MSSDRFEYLPHLRRAIRLAMDGRGRVEPNPMVGCVLVRGGRVIGEGIHARFGGPHAEPTALADSRARGNDPRGATACVTLEPCCHTHKKTPPCVPALIAAGIARVIVGAIDPNPAVDGRGLAMLRDAGVEVILADEIAPELAAEARQLLAAFVCRTRLGRPYVTVKWAESSDGRIAGPGGRRVAISADEGNRAVHALRGRCDAIMVGVATALADDPLLSVRLAPAGRTPVRIVIDRTLQLPTSSQLVRTAGELATIVVTSPHAPPDRRRALQGLGVRVVTAGSRDGPGGAGGPGAEAGMAESAVRAASGSAGDDALLRADLSTADLPATALPAADLPDRPAAHVLVESGGRLAQALFDANLCDRLWVLRSPRTIARLAAGDDDAPHEPLPDGRGLPDRSIARDIGSGATRELASDKRGAPEVSSAGSISSNAVSDVGTTDDGTTRKPLSDRSASPGAPAAVGVPTRFVRTASLALGSDQLDEYLNTAGPTFAAVAESADLVLTRDAARELRMGPN